MSTCLLPFLSFNDPIADGMAKEIQNDKQVCNLEKVCNSQMSFQGFERLFGTKHSTKTIKGPPKDMQYHVGA